MLKSNARPAQPNWPTAPTTERLLLRPPQPSDAASLFEFLGDPSAMRFTHCHASLRECRRRLAGFEWQRRRARSAPWAVLSRASGRLIGWGGLYEDPFEPGWGLELGYAFHPAAWGQGFAGELARACMAWADGSLAAPEVRAFVHPENTASRRLLKRAGFETVGFLPDKRRWLLRRGRSGS